MFSLGERGDETSIGREHVGATERATGAGVRAPLREQQPIASEERVVERERLGDHARRDSYVGKGLARAWVRAHRRSDEEAIRCVSKERLADPRVIRSAGETRPHIQLGGADRVWIHDVHTVDVTNLPPTPNYLGDRAPLGGGNGRRLVGVTDQLRVGSMEKNQRPCAESIALADGDLEVREAAALVQPVHIELRRDLRRAASHEEGVHRLHCHIGHGAGRGGDRLSE
jgi:hypothetical protein